MTASGNGAKDELLRTGSVGGPSDRVRFFGFEAGEFFADGLNDEGGTTLALAGLSQHLEYRPPEYNVR